MKKLLLFCMLIAYSAIGFSQTYPIQDVDECVFLTIGFQQNSTYAASVSNPVGSDASTNVSSTTPSTPGSNTTFGSYFTLPYTINAGSSVDFTSRFYAANAGSFGSGSGQIRISLSRNSINGSFATVATANITGGVWQTVSVSSHNVTTGDNTIDTNVNNAGGFDTVVIQVLSPISSETVYYDNIEFNVNPYLADVNADLTPGNVWLFNNREGDNQLTPSSTFGATSYTTGIATPSTLGNSASTVSRYVKANSFSVLQFAIPALTPPFSGTFKFRVYLDNCAPSQNNVMQIRLRSAANDFYTSGQVTITDKKWVEVSFDLSTLTGSVNTSYTLIDIIVDTNDAAKAGFVYYFDAIQGPFAGATTFTGANNGSWTTASNWSTNSIPNELSDVTIPTGITVGIFNQKVGANNITLQGTGGINLQGAAPELVVKGTVTEGTGNIFFRRNITNLNNWYLMSSPVGGVNFSDTNLATGTGDNKGLATYNTASNSWAYKQTGVGVAATNGFGYSIKSTGSPFIFTGTTINDTDVAVGVVTGGGNNFNLIGNPFLASIKSASFLTANTADLSSQTIWIWNGSTYETKVTVDNFILAPTQGFFVSANKATNLTFAKSIQTTGGVFQKGNGGKTEINLLMTDGSSNRFAKVYYFDNNVSTGFDNGYDGETFSGQSNDFDVFTHLIADNQGKEYQIQSLPTAEMETMIVPVGVKAAAGKEITFTADAMNLPNDVKVFLEDRLTNTITRLDEANASYKVTLNDALNGTGRFYLHTKASGVLSTDDVVLENISIYAINKSTLRVVGLPSGNANVKMYSILGKQVMQTSFSSTGAKEISLPKLSTGMYIIQVETATGKLNKKIVLE